jgi:antitoxin component YwqK of YwqJK toxin-antitoxin module
MQFKQFIKFLLPAFALSFAACTDKPKENILTYKDTGAVMRRYFTVKDKIEGAMLEYYPDGKVKMERNFKEGIQTGQTIAYYPDGKLKERQHYLNGVLEGGDTLFYPNGKSQFIVQFKNGKKDGPLQKWTEDGNLFFEAVYQMDSLKSVKSQNPNLKNVDNQ